MERYHEYKPSGVEWIGKIPAHWNVKKLKYGTLTNRSVLPEKFIEDFSINYIDISSVDSKGNILGYDEIFFSQAPSRARRIVKKGDTIVSTVRTYLKAIAYIPFEQANLICSTGFAVITPLQKLLYPKFLFYLCRSDNFIDAISALSKGVSYPAIDSEDLKGIEIWIPDSGEQTAIAAYLDEKTAQLDTLIANKQKLIELLKEERTAIINHAVTKGLNHDSKGLRDYRDFRKKKSGKSNNRVNQGSDIPEHWEVKKLKYVAEIKYGLGQPPRQKVDGLPLIRATNVERGKIVDKDLIFVDPDDIPYDRDPVLKENDIIVVRSGAYTADSAIIPKEYEGAITGYDMVVRVINADPIFISYCLLSNYVLINQLYLHRLRAAQPHLNKEELGETLLFLPPLSDQRNIVRHIETLTQTIDATLSKIEKEIELLQEYRTALISEVVTGKIKV